MIALLSLIDHATVESIAAHRDFVTTIVLIWITGLGDWTWVAAITLTTILTLWLWRHYDYIIGIVLSVGSSAALTVLIKDLVQRERPDFSFMAYKEVGYSFPSAHAALSLACYGFIAFILFHVLDDPRWRARWVGILLMLVGVVTFSRLYLGVHYPSDLIGGLCVGGIALTLGTFVAKKLEGKFTLR